MIKHVVLLSSCMLFGASTAALAGSPQQHQQVAQAERQNQSQMDSDFQRRMDAAKTPEEKARIQAERDKMIRSQSGTVKSGPPGDIPDRGRNLQPGTSLGERGQSE